MLQAIYITDTACCFNGIYAYGSAVPDRFLLSVYSRGCKGRLKITAVSDSGDDGITTFDSRFLQQPLSLLTTKVCQQQSYVIYLDAQKDTSRTR